MRLIASRTKFAHSLKLSLRMMSTLPPNSRLLAREVGHCDPNDDLRCPAIVGRSGHLRKMLASFAAQLFGRGVLMER
jgi:hypothetical protein